MNTHDFYGIIPEQIKQVEPSTVVHPLHEESGGTWETKLGQRIVCSTLQDFDKLRAQYFPQVPANEWKKVKRRII